MVAENGYVPQNIALTTFTLPVSAAFGDEYYIAGFGSGGWTISQNAGQSIVVGLATSSVGVSGSVSSSFRQDSIVLMCVQANTVFKALDWQGNLVVV